jgi:hypothetical protein
MSHLTTISYGSDELTFAMIAGSFGDFRIGDAMTPKMYQLGSPLSEIQVYTEQT